jgi:hypothetical protein
MRRGYSLELRGWLVARVAEDLDVGRSFSAKLVAGLFAQVRLWIGREAARHDYGRARGVAVDQTLLSGFCARPVRV